MCPAVYGVLYVGLHIKNKQTKAEAHSWQAAETEREPRTPDTSTQTPPVRCTARLRRAQKNARPRAGAR